MRICPSETHVQSRYWQDLQTGTAAALVNMAKCGKYGDNQEFDFKSTL